ncbi:hypothetical protein [Blastococcus tunisiensis]|uniref:Uncharacterized protein n=1 Tax=Blastococcus tunisiensis TaxID=1798228 RepID=A0A1I2H983_9ACTN|nr:hypothetical protein [Blastococcus sp. DSM 46838]SFF25933.1 hypothetical protein SAMN05216574_110172 [Blastococcus sp. DSM 46838]
MTISDSELEAGLRSLRTRADGIAPPPADLAQRTRERHRTQRRARASWAAGGFAALLVLVGVPVVSAVALGGGTTGIAATSTAAPPDQVSSLAALPTRGSLAGDADWLDAAREFSWEYAATESDPLSGSSAPVSGPPLDTRVVAFAGDVPGARVALVLGLTGRPLAAWFVGPVGAAPDQMVLAAPPGETTWRHPLALMDAPDPASDSATLVVVAWPGDEVELLTGRAVSADGETAERRIPVPTTDGAGAISTPGPPGWHPETQLWVQQAAGSYNPQLTVTDRALARERPLPDVADPRGLRGSVRDQDVRAAVEALAGYYGVPAADLTPTLLAGAPVSGGSRSTVVLVGVTFPSGATTAAQVIVWGDDDAPSGLASQVALTAVGPAGTDLLDRVFVVPSSVPGAILLTVSGPADAVLAEAYSPDGTLIMRLPLTEGAGTAAAAANPGDATVRFFDRAGSLVAESALTEPVNG